MSDSADSPDDPGVVRGRKRERNIGEWRQNEAKNKRNRGKEYVSRATGRHIPKRSVGPPCRDGCFEKVTMPIVSKIHSEFWKIGDFALQNAYVQKCVIEKPVKRRRKVQNPNAERRRSATRQYSFTYDGVSYMVCKAGFLSILGISETRVKTALNSVSQSGCLRGDLRGRHPCPRKIPAAVVDRVKQHIRSFPTVSSHYTRAKSPHMRYLHGNLNIKKLYRLYQAWMEEFYPNEMRVKMSFYRMKFNGFKLGFKPPTTDSCSRCDSLKVSIDSAAPGDKAALQQVHLQHVLDEEGNMEQYILPSHSVKPTSMTKLSMPSSPQPGPSQQSHHLASSQPEVQPTSLHSLPQQPLQVTKHADTSKCGTPLSTPSPQAGPSWDVAPLPSSSPKAALPAAGPGRQRNGKLDNMAITPRMLTIQNGILNETRNIGASMDKIGDQLEVMNSTFSSHLKAMTGVLQVIANSLVESAYKEK